MHKIAKVVAATTASVILATVTAGCSEGETKSVPELPNQICWGALDSQDVAPLLPTGKKALELTKPTNFPQPMPPGSTALCTIRIDGLPSFQVLGWQRSYEKWVKWDSVAGKNPDRIDVGKKGLIWHNGAATYFVCVPPKAPSGRGSFIEFRLTTFSTENPKKEILRILPELLRKLVAFAGPKLGCQ
ncbi:hypothetical protein PUR28_14160 [Streptomyces sp. BE308]|uniref:hypothetical protein n=1 Tax=Streptomyces sp. BE308 TaxID=3002529 RepID=UPI002E7992B4|nr:hypothetical protein [Streptomyces sp. BE308]MEE1791901.1 hypothetical protein [Streptomyces sp. BE308]